MWDVPGQPARTLQQQLLPGAMRQLRVEFVLRPAPVSTNQISGIAPQAQPGFGNQQQQVQLSNQQQQVALQQQAAMQKQILMRPGRLQLRAITQQQQQQHGAAAVPAAEDPGAASSSGHAAHNSTWDDGSEGGSVYYEPYQRFLLVDDAGRTELCCGVCGASIPVSEAGGVGLCDICRRSRSRGQVAFYSTGPEHYFINNAGMVFEGALRCAGCS